MGQNIIYNDDGLSYDEVCDKFSYVRDDCIMDEDFTESMEENASYISQYTREEIETMLKNCIGNMVDELKRSVKKEDKGIEGIYNTKINSWNETLARMSIHGNLIELKLTNDFITDSNDDIHYVYITLYRNGKGMFTECIECIREEYEFTGSSFVPINENELCFKALNKKQFINRILDELR
ncbi:MAG: hypothetical protein ACI32Y_00680 [Clostridium sp.]